MVWGGTIDLIWKSHEQKIEFVSSGCGVYFRLWATSKYLYWKCALPNTFHLMKFSDANINMNYIHANNIFAVSHV